MFVLLILDKCLSLDSSHNHSVIQNDSCSSAFASRKYTPKLTWSSIIWTLFQYFILLHHVHLTVSQAGLWSPYCIGRGNYMNSSPYGKNLADLLFALTKTNNGYSFFNSSSGQGQGYDTANAIALCRGDIEPDDCVRCVDDATRELRFVCPNQREAAGWYDKCLLSYSNSTLLHVVDEKKVICVSNLYKVSDWVQFNKSLGRLFEQLRGEAAKGGSLRKYAVGNISEPVYSTIYGLMQCTPDLTESQCNHCLQESMLYNLDSQCSYGKVGGRAYRPSCTLSYEIYPFHNETWYPSPPTLPLPTSPSSIASPPSPILPPGRKKKPKTQVFVGLVVAATALIAILVFLVRQKFHSKRKGEDSPDKLEASSSIEFSKHQRDEDDAEEINYLSLATIQAATNNFSLENKLGEGGFGPVYKGKLNDGKEIAVKRLSRTSMQGIEEFKTEVRLIIKLQHKNLVRLLGCCISGHERILVYEYMANSSLDAFLFDPKKCRELDWSKRANIVRGIAKGLRYLHEDSRLKIIHRDMKASNVLLDGDMNPKISDFGTARIFGINQIEANTNRIWIHGTRVQWRDYFQSSLMYIVLGVLLLEIICGRRNRESHHQEPAENLVSHAWRLWKEGKGEELIDRYLVSNCPVSEALRWINVALLCAQEYPKDWPTISSVVFMLEGGELSSLGEPSEPPLSFGRLVTSVHSSAEGFSTGVTLDYEEPTHVSSLLRNEKNPLFA